MKTEKLLSRDDFRESVFKRDNHKCVICGDPAMDAHHLINRNLFKEPFELGGYFLSNGVSLCHTHHLQAENTSLSIETLRERAGIANPVIPDHFFEDSTYDTWGNVVLPTGMRLKGELFNSEPCQIMLKAGGFLEDFSKYMKYPRTYHLPWSVQGKDDRTISSTDIFEGKRVICSLKMDGEATSLYNDYIHARSINSGAHESRNYVKMLHGNIAYMIPENMRICGENLYAQHTITYDNLESYFYVYSIWEDMQCMSWDETCEYAELFGFPTVPVIYDGIYDREAIEAAFSLHCTVHEGYVIRLAESFDYFNFKNSIAKYVRPEFKQALNETDEHWQSKKVVANKLKSKG